MATWKELIEAEMEDRGEGWVDVEASTLSEEELDLVFDDGYGSRDGTPFTIWTKLRVYFPAVYDGGEWVASVARNPDGKATPHVGGG
jgi:hypothetical protein